MERTCDRPVLARWIRLLRAAVHDGIAAAPRDPRARLAAALIGERTHTLERPREPRADIEALFSCLLAHLGLEPSGDPQREHPLGELSDWLRHRGVCPAGIARLLQTTDGQLIAPDPQAQPDTAWYAQLVRLHTVTDYAVFSDDSNAWRVAHAAARLTHREIQPDHATALPWGIHAMILTPDCQSTADWMLNACQIHCGGAPSGAALVILSDALYCLRHVNPERAH